MAKRPTKEDMEIQALKDHLNRQDKVLIEQNRKQDGLIRTVEEMLTILGGSVAMGIPGMRQDVRDLKNKVEKLEKSEATRGQWIISLNNIPGFIVTAVVFIGGVIGILLGLRDLLKKEPPPQQKEIQSQPKPSTYLDTSDYFSA